MSEQEPERSSADWRNWRWLVPHLGGVVAVLLLAGSLLTITIRFSLDAYRWLTRKDSLDVITFSTLAPQAFLNSGDGEIFISHIDIRGDVVSEVININSVIKPKEFLSVPVTEQTLKELGGKMIVATNSEQEWKDIVESKVRTVRDPSYVPVIYFANSPELQLYKASLKERLRTFKAEAHLVYYTSQGQRISMPVPVEGVILH